ncbi:rho-related BTB domain-containing protein 1-like [Mercenaria mercenaria]|uniref:rho-related BTB domain-containing protein 1-like n=1 Tax=Mercenaria mercenaria TaxID=6596 RepID=UPI00234F8ED7|nr:rho-related BTB domain-containing protein 1-like [Mercenaria mercenaria]XP_045190268.2 rho-related BTB domain-containing protein 1-like [Mercenaria mercenaria]XP_045190269.2 rho-related BTB domain-containing protein 1-like [Mercenaria mercenaria]
MFDVEESPIPDRKREQVPCMLYPPTVLNEFIKCVAIGDSGVGKTCLITAWACNTHYNLEQLVKTHVSTVWAHDHYRKDPEILEQSVVSVDGGYVALRLWDTFGYHDKDRGFAYKGADVILLCYSVAMPRSLNNIRKIWIPEIRRRAPTTPVVLVGCQTDLRYLYRDEHYQKIHKGLMYKVVQEKDIITPEQGRSVAKEIGAPYYECSVYTKYGIEDVFLNVIRAAMVEKRKIRFWSAFLRRIQYPQIQAPMKLPPLLLPKIEIPEETLHDDLCDLLHNQSEGDVVFLVRGQCFRAHKICLAVSDIIFEKLFLGSDALVTENANKVLKRSLSSHGNSNINTQSGSETKFRRSSDTVGPDILNIRPDYSILVHSAFLTVEERKACDNPYKPGEVTYQTVVTVRNEITPRAFQFILEYLYTGSVREDYDAFEEVLVACGILHLTDLALMISNLRGGEEYLNMELEKQFKEYRKSKLREIALKKERLTDVRFLVDDGAIRAHKPLLMGRCEMMYAMFNDNFKESSADSIVLPGISRDVFLAIREFLYTGECTSGATLNCLGIIEAANRFCLPRLVRLVEARVCQDLTDADKEGEDIIEDVLKLLEPAQLHNAELLSDWCVKYLSNHFLVIRQKYLKLFHKLCADNIKFIERNKWPPEWYMKELAYFDHVQAQSLKSKKSKRNFQQKQQFSRVDQCTNAASCLCFCRRSKIVVEERDSESPFDSVEP